MHPSRCLLFLVGLCCAVAPAAAAPAPAGTAVAARFAVAGTAGFGSETVPLKSAIARWDPASGELVVALFPFEVNDADVAKVRSLRVIFYVTAGKPSPDPQRWPEAPYLVLSCGVQGGVPPYGVETLSGCNLNAAKWRARSTFGVALDATAVQGIVQAFSLDPADLGRLLFKVHEGQDREGLEGFRYSAVLMPVAH